MKIEELIPVLEQTEQSMTTETIKLTAKVEFIHELINYINNVKDAAPAAENVAETPKLDTEKKQK